MARKSRKMKRGAIQAIRKAKQKVLELAIRIERSRGAATERGDIAKQQAARWLRGSIGADSKRTKQVRRAHGVPVKQRQNLNEGVRAARQVQTGRGKRGNAKRANMVMAQQMSLAQRGQPSTLGDYGRAKVKIFYRATQRYWQGKGPNRNENILKALGVQTLDEAMAIVMAGNGDALKMAMSADKPVNDTNNPDFSYGGYTDIYSSPDYIALVNYV